MLDLAKNEACRAARRMGKEALTWVTVDGTQFLMTSDFQVYVRRTDAQAFTRVRGFSKHPKHYGFRAACRWALRHLPELQEIV